MELEWFAYLHIDGTVHVKRYFDHKDLKEAAESDFVDRIMPPFKEASREEAVRRAERYLG